MRKLKSCENYQNVTERHRGKKSTVHRLAWRRVAADLELVKRCSFTVKWGVSAATAAQFGYCLYCTSFLIPWLSAYFCLIFFFTIFSLFSQPVPLFLLSACFFGEETFHWTLAGNQGWGFWSLLPSLRASCLSSPRGPDETASSVPGTACAAPKALNCYLPTQSYHEQEAPTSALPGECPVLVAALSRPGSLGSEPAVTVWSDFSALLNALSLKCSRILIPVFSSPQIFLPLFWSVLFSLFFFFK